MDGVRTAVIAYARISDLSGKRRTLASVLGVEGQHAACAEIARQEGVTIVKRYSDNDRSASKGETRPAFEAMLTDLYRGHTSEGAVVHGVITVDVDRIYKIPEQWERFITAFRSKPNRVFLDGEGRRDLYAPDADERGLHDVTAVMAENKRRSDRTRRWHAAQAQRGIAHTGGRCFGYRPVPGVRGVIEVVPEEAAVIQEAVAACIDGRGWGAITQIFQRSGLPTEKGGLWRIQTVKQIVSSPRNAGLRLLDGEVVTGPAGEPVLGSWEPIISVTEWEAVRRRYEPRRRAPGGRSASGAGRPPRKYLLSGFLRCGNVVDGRVCGGVLMASARTQGRASFGYRCRPRGDGGCGGTGVRGEWMDQEVGDLVLGILAGLPNGTLSRPDWDRHLELEALLVQRDDLRARRNYGEMSPSLFKKRSDVLDGLLSELLAEREAWEAIDSCLGDDRAERLRRWHMEPGSGGYDLAQRRALVGRVLVSVLVFPSGRGTVRQSTEHYMPVVDRDLVMRFSDAAAHPEEERSARAVSRVRWKVG